MGDQGEDLHAGETSSRSRWGPGFFPSKPAFTATGLYGLFVAAVGSSISHSKYVIFAGVLIITVSLIGYIAATWIAVVALILAMIIGPIVILSVVLQLSLGSMDQKPPFLANPDLAVPVGACAIPVVTTIYSDTFSTRPKTILAPPQSGQDPSAFRYFFFPPKNLNDERAAAAARAYPLREINTSTAAECEQVAKRRLSEIPWVIIIPIVIFCVVAIAVSIIARYVFPVSAEERADSPVGDVPTGTTASTDPKPKP